MEQVHLQHFTITTNYSMISDLGTPASVQDLVDRLESISRQKLEDVDYNKIYHDLQEHPLKRTLWKVLCEMKEQKAILMSPPDIKDVGNLARLDKMLMIEGIFGPNMGVPSGAAEVAGDQKDYGRKLTIIRKKYNQQMEEYKQRLSNFVGHLTSLLQQHSHIRPITPYDRNRIMEMIENKFEGVEVQIKQSACELVMHHKTRLLDARHKRRNFSKQQSEILNEYFYTIGHYPTEQEKEKMAKQCGITVAQVSNWFGNKRIRNKRKPDRSKEEEEMMYMAKKASTYALKVTYGYGIPYMTTPYSGMLPGGMCGLEFPSTTPVFNSGFDPSSYTPQVMNL